jgi:amidohydrolase/hippurate hydrolase
MSKLTDIEKSINKEIVAVWHHLHQNPELSMREYQTADYIEKILRKTTKNTRIERVCETGLWVELEGSAPRDGKERIVALRGDMDALPLQEQNDLPYRSTVPGVMHACGHDVHTSCLLGAVRILEQYREQIPGRVWFFFQPGEETLRGAKSFLSNPAIDFTKPQLIAGIHVGTDLEAGKIGLKEGPVMASADMLRFRIRGQGSHASRPQTARDPVVAAAYLIVELQTLVSREVAAVDSAVLSLCSIHGGTKDNIIPDEVLIEGTLRTLDKKTREYLQDAIRRVCQGTALSLRVTIEFEVADSSLPLINDPDCVKIAAAAAKKVLGEDSVVFTKTPKMGAEDFAFFTDKIPGVFIIIGSKTPGGRTAQNHSVDFYTDPRAVRAGILSLSGFALEYFGVPV